MSELKDMQDAMGGQEEAVNLLAVPDTWTQESKDGLSTDAKLIKLAPNSPERAKIENDFMRRMGSRKSEVKISKVSRIENVGLWQSYAAKKSSMFMRGRNEGLDQSKLDDYEKPMMYHGTNPDVVPKITQQGFNRMFCGKNAVRYGKGVYFAITAAYSHNYAQADSSGVKRMFVCRVLKGETSQGHNEQLVPEVRVAATNQMYDSTTDGVDRPEPPADDPGKYGGTVRQMYVVYHDAQAYPEYLIEYKNK